MTTQVIIHIYIYMATARNIRLGSHTHRTHPNPHTIHTSIHRVWIKRWVCDPSPWITQRLVLPLHNNNNNNYYYYYDYYYHCCYYCCYRHRSYTATATTAATTTATTTTALLLLLLPATHASAVTAGTRALTRWKWRIEGQHFNH